MTKTRSWTGFSIFATTLILGLASSSVSISIGSFGTPPLVASEGDIVENPIGSQLEANPQFVGESTPDGPQTVQSSTVEFPVNGRVMIKAIEEVGKFPKLIFTSEKNGKSLLSSEIQDEDRWLIPVNDSIATQPSLRFKIINTPTGPLIMSVAIYHGGSDNAFFLTVFGEVMGKIKRLNSKPIFANIQGGFYIGRLNYTLGYGVVTWNFIWGHRIDEGHYSKHKYEVEVFKVENGRLTRKAKVNSRRMYDSDKSNRSVRELHIDAYDQRTEIPLIKDFLD